LKEFRNPSLRSLAVADVEQFVYGQSMNVDHHADLAAARIAAAIGEPARARMLYSLLDGRIRTSTELAVIAEVSPSTASAHLSRLKSDQLVKVVVQGKQRLYSLKGPGVARALEGLSVLAGRSHQKGAIATPIGLRTARTCYDHMAGALAVSLRDRFQALGWFSTVSTGKGDSYDLTSSGVKGLEALGICVETTRKLRRRFAFACLDWSERRPHLGGALAAALLQVLLTRKWVLQDLDSRALAVTSFGRREFLMRFTLEV
jgi:DNA-binding transcriptional ArsR family regulator